MRVVVDLQGAQAANARRGIGNYSLALADHLAAAPREHEIVVALNGAFADATDELTTRFRSRGLRTDVWFPPADLRGAVVDDRWTSEAAEVVREEFLASVGADVVLVSSLFEGFGDPAITSVKRSRTTPTAVVLYDLIPLIRRSDYLVDPRMEAWYEDRLRHLRRADRLLAISGSTREEAVEWIGADPGRVIDIGAGAHARFVPGEPTDRDVRAARARAGLGRPHLLYTGGIDPRKNLDRLIEAFALLPTPLRTAHQLAIVCSVRPQERAHLEAVAAAAGLGPDEVVLTGFVPDDDLVVLTQSAVGAVFPSLHEGFGLPVLEAMKCGTPVVTSDRSSLPEVIGRPDAMFDPTSVDAIASSLARLLGDEEFRADLRRHVLARSERFSWERSASATWDALEALHEEHSRSRSGRSALPPVRPGRARPRLGMLTPLPPLPSGISDYSALLLPELARHYDVEVVTDDAVDDAAVRGSATIRSTDWFRANHRQYDRIVYHLGNSEFHSHMFDLLAEIPGVVVLHDFALSGIVSHMDGLGQSSEPWRNDLYRSHGWSGLLADRAAADRSAVVWAHPVSLSPLQNALGVIVHSQAARRLADQWYGTGAADGWQVIPMPRATAGRPTRTDARRALGLGDELVVCSFGMVGPTKLSDRLVEAWCASAAAHTDGARLVFVGEHGDPAFTQHLRDTIERSAGAEVEVTGRVDEDTYARYLAAADIGVQLRARSRGETSASAYDCLASGLATIANANGSLAELPTAAVVLLDDDFRIDDLRDAIDRLASDPSERARLGTAGRAHVERHHRPTPVADRMVEAIEAISAEPTNRRRAVPALLREVPHTPPTRLAVRSVAQSIAHSLTASPAPAQLLVDVSELNVTDAGSGIQRVTRNLVRQLLSDPPDGFRVEPVAATTGTDYRYARRFTSRLLGVDLDLDDDAIDVSARDVFLGLDLQPQVVPAHRATLRRLRQRGVRVAFVVYDLLPINSPEFFLPGAREIYERWMRTVRESDALLSISSSVRADVAAWLAANPVLGGDPALGWFHLGGDLDGLHPWAEFSGTPGRRPATSSPEFLMVGTIEPRKGHQQVLDAMELLWAQGHTARLTIIGRHGWMMEQFVEHLRHHPEAGRRLHVVEAATDAELAEAYRRSDCLVVASRGEGFGLPLIEAARHDLPVLARDLAVFREVAGDAVQYFSGDTPAELAAALVRQIELAAAGDLQGTAGMRTLSWHESSRELLAALEATVGLSHPAC